MQDPLDTPLRKMDTKVRMPRVSKVKNKTAAPIQITAEQIVREAKERQEEVYEAPRQKITDAAELSEYRLQKRKSFEDVIRRTGRWQMGVWIKYAQWEEIQKDYPRARSVWERALDVDYRTVVVWMKYAEMEMKAKFVNHARNVWDRAVGLLPRVDQLWYRYIHMEEALGNVAGARNVFERWVKWEPDHAAWRAYAKLELRYNEVDRARAVYEKYVVCHPTVRSWVAYAKFEVQLGARARARVVYERAAEVLGAEAGTEELFVMFAKFEEKCKEVDRARAIYRYALDRVPKAAAGDLFSALAAFEKQHGDRAGIEDVVVGQRRLAYEERLVAAPRSYDLWFDYAGLEESAGDPARVRDVYERAIAQVPPAAEKRYWRRYIYLWIKYALYEEVDAGDVDRARAVYREALRLVPHKSFTFAKLWLLAAQLELRQKDLGAARKLLGTAIGCAPKDKLFRFYIDLELQLGNVDRCRALYGSYLAWAPDSCAAWSRYADLERTLGEAERATAIFELAISQPSLDAPERLWKAYIDLAIGAGDRLTARSLYERLLERTGHCKVWLSYAAFEAAPLPTPEGSGAVPAIEGGASSSFLEPTLDAGEAADARAAAARGVYERGYASLKSDQPEAKEERLMLLEAWRAMERAMGSDDSVAAVERRLPKRVKRRRAVETPGGLPAGVEEYYDYLFPDDQAAAPSLKILEAAYRWKKQKLTEGGGADDGDAGGTGGGGGWGGVPVADAVGAGAGEELPLPPDDDTGHDAETDY